MTQTNQLILLNERLVPFRAVDCNQDSFTDDPHIEEIVKEINKITWEMKKNWSGDEHHGKYLYRFRPFKNEIYLLGDIKALQKASLCLRYARDYLN
ncbi:MAG: hypothetical protein ACLSTW_00575 [Faecalibacterium sp.]